MESRSGLEVMTAAAARLTLVLAGCEARDLAAHLLSRPGRQAVSNRCAERRGPCALPRRSSTARAARPGRSTPGLSLEDAIEQREHSLLLCCRQLLDLTQPACKATVLRTTVTTWLQPEDFVG